MSEGGKKEGFIKLILENGLESMVHHTCSSPVSKGKGRGRAFPFHQSLVRAFNVTIGESDTVSETFRGNGLESDTPKEFWREAKAGELLLWNSGESSCCNSSPSSSSSKNM